MNREQQQDKFNQIYAGLNNEQRLAVNTLEGPVMVIAGPGTGKTQILGARIGKILLETDAKPENILCLTYTDAGVVAMRKRLVSFIGPDAYKVNIYTYHAFCNDVIQAHSYAFPKAEMETISELEQIELMQQVIDRFHSTNPLKRYRGDVYYEINNLLHLTSTIKKEGWTKDFLFSCIDSYVESLANRPEYVYKRKTKTANVGDLKMDQIMAETAKMNKLKAAIEAIEQYQQLMLARNRYDFDDMINWVLNVFRNNTEVLQTYQEQYLYVLVDEYQDTSGTQNSLVQLLIDYWESPNVFVVGDDDQSIYRFQGANVENMEAFAVRYQEQLRTVVLTSNYRSVQPILDAAKAVIDNNTERLVNKIEGLSKNLTAANTALQALNIMPTIVAYATPHEEMAGIAMEVAKLVQQQQVHPHRIAIIYRENKYGENITRYLQALQVAVYSKRSKNLLVEPLAVNVIQTLRYLNAEHDTPGGGDEMLFEILHYAWWKIPPMEIAKASMARSDANARGANITFRQWLYEQANAPQQELFAVRLHPALQQAFLTLEKLIGLVANLTIQHLLDHVIKLTDVLAYIMQSDHKFWLMQVIHALYKFVEEEHRRNQRLTLAMLVRNIDTMMQEGISLPLVDVTGNDKGVHLLTAHGSKGLEYEYVFVCGCTSANWEKKRKPSSGYTFPDTIFSTTNVGNELEELRRLFFVALTRAEQHLHISYNRYNDGGKAQEASCFIVEIQDAHPNITTEIRSYDAATLLQFRALQLTVQQPELPALERAYVERQLERFVMNVTALNTYLKCKIEFYFKNILRIPSPKSESLEFGSAVHFALEKLFRDMQANNYSFPSKDAFVGYFNWYMRKHRESFMQEAFDRRLEYGATVLGNYYNNYINSFNTVVAIERNIRGVVVNGVPLKGKLDKLEFDGSDVTVVDYKTGKVENGLKKIIPPSDEAPDGGDYWRQAVFYKLLVDNYEQKQWNVVAAEFDFIEPNEKNNYEKRKVFITQEDVTTLTQIIRRVWDGIQAHDFYTGCGASDCKWCNFVKNNQLHVALHTPDTDEDVAMEDADIPFIPL
ncbi:MAG TPA: DNA helicase UvrD [Chitinophagaceae bacterium]|nr:DNA helicase UvrD [Chitinophagaceae bacterium]